MKKSLLLISIFLLLCSLPFNAGEIFAVPANPLPDEIVQPDGTKIRVFIKGDEFQNWVVTENG